MPSQRFRNIMKWVAGAGLSAITLSSVLYVAKTVVVELPQGLVAWTVLFRSFRHEVRAVEEKPGGVADGDAGQVNEPRRQAMGSPSGANATEFTAGSRPSLNQEVEAGAEDPNSKPRITLGSENELAEHKHPGRKANEPTLAPPRRQNDDIPPPVVVLKPIEVAPPPEPPLQIREVGTWCHGCPSDHATYQWTLYNSSDQEIVIDAIEFNPDSPTEEPCRSAPKRCTGFSGPISIPLNMGHLRAGEPIVTKVDIHIPSEESRNVIIKFETADRPSPTMRWRLKGCVVFSLAGHSKLTDCDFLVFGTPKGGAPNYLSN